ncbi:MAG: DUF4349 domain-containing protein, partial [Armatimonadota bacterium]
MLEHGPCDEWIERVSAHADEELDEAEKGEARAHLDECDACRQWLEQVRADREVLVGNLARQKRRWGFARGVMQEVAKRRVYGHPANAAPRRWRFTAIELAVSCLVICVCAAVLFPVFSKVREKARHARCGVSSRTIAQARQAACPSNLKQICLAMLMYEDDFDAFPPHENWTEAIFPYTRNNEILICPEDKQADLGYGYNPALAGRDLKTIDDPTNTVLVYDARDGKLEQRHDDGAYYGFVDGEVKWLEDPPPGFLHQQSLGPPTRNYGLAEKLRIAYQAEQDVEVEDVPVAVMQAEREIDRRGGFLLNSDLTRNSSRLTAQIVFRVPVEEMLSTMNALAKLGAVLNRHIAGQDLTEKYVLAQRAVRSEAQKQERLGRIERRTRQTAEKLELAKK